MSAPPSLAGGAVVRPNNGFTLSEPLGNAPPVVLQIIDGAVQLNSESEDQHDEEGGAAGASSPPFGAGSNSSSSAAPSHDAASNAASGEAPSHDTASYAASGAVDPTIAIAPDQDTTTPPQPTVDPDLAAENTRKLMEQLIASKSLSALREKRIKELEAEIVGLTVDQKDQEYLEQVNRDLQEQLKKLHRDHAELLMRNGDQSAKHSQEIDAERAQRMKMADDLIDAKKQFAEAIGKQYDLERELVKERSERERRELERARLEQLFVQERFWREQLEQMIASVPSRDQSSRLPDSSGPGNSEYTRAWLSTG